MIDLKNVHLTFNKGTPMEHQVFDNFNLSINEGEFVGIVGGNGAGKSTLMKILAGDLKLEKGSIHIANMNMTKLTKPIRAKQISIISQDPLLGTFANLTVEENLALALKRGRQRSLLPALNAKNKEMYKAQLKLLSLGLENKLMCKMGLLSGGQRQAICLLMAFLQEAKVILLDEHTAALDPKSSECIMKLTAQFINNNGITAMMITHDLQQTIQYCSKIIVMHNGKIAKIYQDKDKDCLTVEDLYKDIGSKADRK